MIVLKDLRPPPSTEEERQLGHLIEQHLKEELGIDRMTLVVIPDRAYQRYRQRGRR